MPPSQLKQLKASLRDHGVLGPQKSKKQRKENAKDATKRLQRNAALEGIRERFNPFEAKAPARKEKFEVASGKPTKTAIGRPGVTRGLGEERRRDTLLREIQSRNKVGGMLDRRFGENDPSMSLEEKAAERFAKQSLRTAKKNSMFNLEDDSDEELLLTHGGRSLDFGEETRDDFAEDVSGSDEEKDFDAQDDRPRKRVRLNAGDEEDDDDDMEDIPERKKTKNEVMKEVIAKSKMYKAERQAAKADDDDLRAELDQGMGDFYDALQGYKPVPAAKQLPSPPVTDTEPTMDPGRAAMLAGKSREAAEKEYEANLRQLKLEARSRPSVRTKTEEEQATEQAAKLEELERKRIRRMKGEAETSDEEEDEDAGDGVEDLDENEDYDDAEAFGLAQPDYPPRPQLEVEDEDEFVFDDIVASDSDADAGSSDSGSESEVDEDDDGDDEFINGLVLPKSTDIPSLSMAGKPSKNLAYTFPCPQTHDELLEVTKDAPLSDLPVIVQRIRALYHKGLGQENKKKLAKFAEVLVEHISFLANDDAEDFSFPVLDALIRHLHSMAKTQPEDIGMAMREHLRKIAELRPLELLPGDLLVLTAVSTIFPTSDHFHPVATPAMLTITRYLGQSLIRSLQDLGRGAYACTLALQYQTLARRYVPEVVIYVGNALAVLAPTPPPELNSESAPLDILIRLPASSLRLLKKQSSSLQSLSFNSLRSNEEDVLRPDLLLNTFITLSSQMANLWQSKSAFPEIISPIQRTISHLLSPACRDVLSKSLRKSAQQTLDTIEALTIASIANRKPLLLHNHRPLAIKSSDPHFVENFNPDRHYDPDRDRAEMAKLTAEHKKERKGAIRELRKDANFIAREQLREKKAKDEAYDKKFKRVIAEIQGEEGKEAKEYEREKRKRKGKF